MRNVPLSTSTPTEKMTRIRNLKSGAVLGLILMAAALVLSSCSGTSATAGRWRSLGPQGGWVAAIVASPAFAADRTIFIVTGDGVSKSTDGGTSWTKLEGLKAPHASKVLLSPAYAADRTLFVLADNSLHVSRDGGLTWRKLTGAGMAAAAAVSPNYAHDRTILAGSLDRGLVKSSDGGENWTSVADMGRNQVEVIAFSPDYAADRTIFIARRVNGLGWNLGNDFLKSDDGGKTWHPLSFARSLRITSVTFSPKYRVDKTIFAGGESGLFKSVDAGQTWTLLSGLPGMDNIAEVAISPDYADDKQLYFTRIAGDHFDGLFHSLDAGRTWRRSLGDRAVTAVAFSPDFKADATVFVGTTEGFLRSTNRGGTWRDANKGLSSQDIGSIVFSPDFMVDKVIFAATDREIYRSTKTGRDWTRIKRGPAGVVKPSIALSRAYASDHMVLVGDSGGIYQSVNRGQSWSRLKIGGVDSGTIEKTPVAFSPNFAVDRTMATVIPSARMWLTSTNRGRSWQRHKITDEQGEVDSIVFSPDYAVDRTIFAGGSRHLYRSRDAGRRWRLIFNLTEATFGKPAVSPNYANDKTVLLPVGEDSPQGPFKSTDGGDTWRAVRRGLPSTFSQRVAFSPAYAADRTMFVATDGPRAGVYRSTDSGRHWKIVGTTLENTVVNAIAPSPDYANDKTIFAGTRGGGVMVYTFTD